MGSIARLSPLAEEVSGFLVVGEVAAVFLTDGQNRARPARAERFEPPLEVGEVVEVLLPWFL